MMLKDVDDVFKAARAGDESCRTLFTKLSPHLNGDVREALRTSWNTSSGWRRRRND